MPKKLGERCFVSGWTSNPLSTPLQQHQSDLIFTQIVPAQEYNFKFKKKKWWEVLFHTSWYLHLNIYRYDKFSSVSWPLSVEWRGCFVHFPLRCTDQFSQKQQSLLTSRNQKEVPSRGNLAVSVENSSKISVLKQNCKGLTMFWP